MLTEALSRYSPTTKPKLPPQVPSLMLPTMMMMMMMMILIGVVGGDDRCKMSFVMDAGVVVRQPL